MRILYGVCGEGMGHASIASEIIPYLEKQGHTIKIATYGKGVSFLRKHDIFPVEGLLLYYAQGGVDYFKTFYSNVRDFPKNILHAHRIHQIVEEFKPDLCITDNEPIVAMISYWWNLPLISLSALNSFTFNDVKQSLSKKHESLIAKAVTRSIVPKANVTIGLSLTEKTFRKNGVIFTSPVIRTHIQKLKPVTENFVLVYLAKSHEYLLQSFAHIDARFVVYGMYRQKNRKNLVFKHTPETFADDLARCKAVISNAGFSVLAEAVYLQKPIFMIPVKNQYEQFYNCLVAQKKGVGTFSEEPSRVEIQNFLEELQIYRAAIHKIRFDPNEPLRIIGNAIAKWREKCAR